MNVLIGHFTKHWRRAEAWQQRYARDAHGATAIEFAILAVPFLAILFAILELALIFFTGAIMTQAISDTGRMVRVGSFQGCGSASEFKALVCNRMKNMMNCQANLRVDLFTASDFQSVVMTDPGMSGLDPDDEDSEIEDGEFADTNAGEPVVLRGTFYYPLALPPVITRLENLSGSGRHVISVSTAFRNEPFPENDTCNSSILDEIDDVLDGAGDLVAGL